jgi:integral membrane sensor domain MASE1
MHPNARLVLAVLLVCAGYYGTGIVALALRLEPGGISTIWLPHDVLLAALILTHGGRIWAEGRPEGGAAFRFTLPTGPAA